MKKTTIATIAVGFTAVIAFASMSSTVSATTYALTLSGPASIYAENPLIVRGTYSEDSLPKAGVTINIYDITSSTMCNICHQSVNAIGSGTTDNNGVYVINLGNLDVGSYTLQAAVASSMVVFSDPLAVRVAAARLDTVFTIWSSATTPTTNVAFTLAGKLKSGTTALSNQPVHLERRTLTGGTWGAWANVANTYKYTDATGAIKLSQTVSTAGTYQYRWHFTGSATYQAAYSAAVTETVKKPSIFTITTSTATPTVNVAFTLSGTLKSGTTGLAGYSVHLERRFYVSGTWGAWANVAGTTRTTGTGGVIPSVSQTLTGTGTVQYRWHFAGTATYLAKYSAAVTETVKKPTSMTISTSTTAPKLNVAFTVSGTLKSGTTGLVGYSVHLERKVGTGAWGDVTGTTKTTGTGGTIPLVAQVMTAYGTYSYRWHFAGTGTYKPCYSPVKSFTV